MGIPAAQALETILSGRAPERLAVEGNLDLTGIAQPFALPRGLSVSGNLVLNRSAVTEIPDGVEASGTIEAVGCTHLVGIGRGVKATELDLSRCRGLVAVDHPFGAKRILRLDGCTRLERIAGPLRCDVVSLTGCRRLSSLPEPLQVSHLGIEGCTALRRLPAGLPAGTAVTVDRRTALAYQPRFLVKRATARFWIATGRARSGLRVAEILDLRDRVDLESLPDPLSVQGDLLLEGCRRLRRLPSQLEVSGVLDLKGCPEGLVIPQNVRAKRIVLPSGHVQEGKPPAKGIGVLDLLMAPVHLYRASSFLDAIDGRPSPRVPGLPPEEARRRIRDGATGPLVVDGTLELSDLPELETVPSPLWVRGDLILRNNARLSTLPEGLRIAGGLEITGCPAFQALPGRLSVERLTLQRCPSLRALPADLICGALEIESCEGLTAVPESIRLAGLVVQRCPQMAALPDELVVHRLTLNDLPALARLPSTVVAHELTLMALPQVDRLPARLEFEQATFAGMPLLEALPEGIEAELLTVERCPRLRALPPRLRTSEQLAVRRCAQLQEVPAETVAFDFSCEDAPLLPALRTSWSALRNLSLDGCGGLSALPEGLVLVKDGLRLRGCRRLARLPAGLSVLGRVDLGGCASLAELPALMPPPERAEIGGSGLRQLPPGWEKIPIAWHRVPVTVRMLFEPHTIPVEEILGERNVEVRRVTIERLGFERFIQAAGATVVDSDRDAGGTRELVRVPLTGDEDMVALRVHCPSTGRLFCLRVPPATPTCRAAAAWLAGFHDPSDYNPLLET